MARRQDAVKCALTGCGRVFQNGNSRVDNQNGMENHYKNHFMSCFKCSKQFMDRDANLSALRKKLEKHQVSRQCGANAVCPYPDCERVFSYFENRKGNENSMQQHRQIHQPRNIACILCGALFRSSADAAQHVEAGACPKCPGGKVEARKTIFNYIRHRQDTQCMLTVGLQHFGPLPDYPYECTHCNRQTANFGSLLKHEESCHGNNLAVLGKGFRKFIRNSFRSQG